MANIVSSSGGGVGSDERVKVSPNDTTADFLLDKLDPGANISIVESNGGGDEQVTISASVPPIPNLFTSVATDSGSFNATSTADSLNVAGLGGIATSTVGSVIVIDGSSIGSSITVSDETPNIINNVEHIRFVGDNVITLGLGLVEIDIPSAITMSDGVTTVNGVSAINVTKPGSLVDLTNGVVQINNDDLGAGSQIDITLQYEFDVDLNDASSSGADLTEFGTVSLVAGTQGNAASFPGTNTDYLSSPVSNLGQLYGDKDWFISMWVNPSSIGAFQFLYTKADFNQNKKVVDILLTSGDNIRFAVGEGSGNFDESNVDSTTTLAMGTWYHVMAVHDSTNDQLRLYINGALENTSTGYPGLTGVPGDDMTLTSFIGVRAGNNGANIDLPFNGLVDQFHKGNFIPTQTQINKLANGVPNALEAFEEPFPLTITDGVTTVAGVKTLTVTGGTLTDTGNGTATLAV